MPETADAQTHIQIQREIAEALRALVIGQRGEIGTGQMIGPSGFPLTDPTKLTTEAVNRATDNWRRELGAAVEILTTRLAGMDTATKINAERIAEIPEAADAQREHLRQDIDRQVLGLRELHDGRLDSLDATVALLGSSVQAVPADVDRAVKALREIMSADIRNVQDVATQKFEAIEGTFASNALALTAALAAQKEAAAEQNKSNTLAITKSEQATKETIAANAAQTTNSLASQAATIDDIKQRVVRIESGGLATAAAHNSQLADDSYSQAGRIAQAAQAASAQAAQRATISLVIAGIVGLVGIISALFAVIHG